MPGNRCLAREADALRYLVEHGPSSAADIAAALGVKSNTAGQYLQGLRRDGKAWHTGVGCRATWTAGVREPCDRQAAIRAAIEQCPSVWHYAERMR